MDNQLFDLSGKVALVTGAAEGICFALACGLGEAGARVVISGRSKERLQHAISKLTAEGLAASGHRFSVASAAEVRAAIPAIEKEVGPIDILVNNAGIQRRSPLEQFSEAAWREVLDTNLTGIFLVSQQVARGMIERKTGKIINVCSLMCEVARPTIAAYTAAKGGVQQLTKAMAIEWAKHNIQVNGLGPGYIRTEMNRALTEDPQFDSWIKARTPIGRWGEPADLAGTAVFLASAASNFITGQIIYVDGGIL